MFSMNILSSWPVSANFYKPRPSLSGPENFNTYCEHADDTLLKADKENNKNS